MKRLPIKSVMVVIMFIFTAYFISVLAQNQITPNLHTAVVETTTDSIANKVMASAQASPVDEVGAKSADSSAMTSSPMPSKVLFIGNSLLLGSGTFGMAASDSKHDYYYYVTEKMRELNPLFTSKKLSGVAWEHCSTRTDQTAWLNGTLEPALTADLNLVIIQLGDNVYTSEGLAILQQGAVDLLKFIQRHCPDAQLVWVGEWYSSDDKQTDIARSCSETGGIFIDISDLRTRQTESVIGNVITDDHGNKSVIRDKGIASHPGDSGMLAIANRICYKLGITECEGEIT